MHWHVETLAMWNGPSRNLHWNWFDILTVGSDKCHAFSIFHTSQIVKCVILYIDAPAFTLVFQLVWCIVSQLKSWFDKITQVETFKKIN